MLALAFLVTISIHQLPKILTSAQNVPVEIELRSTTVHSDPFNDLVVDAVFRNSRGVEQKVPAFWAGGDRWKVRFASPKPGTYSYETICSDLGDRGLNGVRGEVTVQPNTGSNPLFLHGGLRVSRDKRHLEHLDGEPFFWLGDTWWMGLAERLHWPDEFQRLTEDRVKKGFNVVQIVAGLYPDMFPFDKRGANEAGFPWEAEYARIRPEYFDRADIRIRYLIEKGITPCIVGAWGYFLPWMGVDRMKKHWRYLIARYGSYPVVWCAAGEANLPWYLAKGFPYDDREQVKGWTEVLRSIRATDSFHRLLTIHPTAINQYTSRHATDDAGLLDFDLLQTPHGRMEAAQVTVEAVQHSIKATPKMPVIDGEAAYEMLSDSLPTEWTRAMFWICMMNGAAGHTYGANGIWQNNRPDDPHGRSPNGPGYGRITSQEAMNLPGSQQIAMGMKFLKQFPWRKLEPLRGGASYSNSSRASLASSHWIWFPEGTPNVHAPVAKRWFRRSFQLNNADVTSADIRITADDACSVWINGQPLGSSTDWRVGAEFKVAQQYLKSGKNVIAVEAENLDSSVTQNPAGMNAELAIQMKSGATTRIQSDASWLSSSALVSGWQLIDFDDIGWAKAKVLGSMGMAPWGNIAAGSGIEPQSAGISTELRFVYVLRSEAVVIHGLEKGGSYVIQVFDPVIGHTIESKIGPLVANDVGDLTIQAPGNLNHDWLIIAREMGR